MNGQMMNFKRYMESLNRTPERIVDRVYPIDYRGLIAYARQQGKHPNELSEEEKNRYIIST